MFGKKKRQLRQEQEKTRIRQEWRDRLLQMLAQAEAGDITSEELGTLSYAHKVLRVRRKEVLTADERQRWEYAHARLVDAEEFPQDLERLRRLYSHYQAAEDSEAKIESLIYLLDEFRRVREKNRSRLESEVGISATQVSEYLEEVVSSLYQGLKEACDSSGALLQLDDFIQRTYPNDFTDSRGRWAYADLHRAGVKRLPYPEDWNELVARHFDTPALELFEGLKPRGSGDVRLLAAEALRTDDFTYAQIALAYCNGNPKYRAAVGDVLTAELAKLVVRHRAEAITAAEQETA